MSCNCKNPIKFDEDYKVIKSIAKEHATRDNKVYVIFKCGDWDFQEMSKFKSKENRYEEYILP